MKKAIQILFVLFLFAACTPQTYYQLSETSSQSLLANRDNIFYDNEDIEITYNFWSDRGNGSFVLYNKTDKDIYVDLKRSHLIINDYSFTYYQNRTYSTPKVSLFSSFTDDEIQERRNIQFPGVTPKNLTKTAAEVVIFNEERIICIPPNSFQMIYGFNLQTEFYRDCNLLRFPKPKEIVSTEFSSENSPLIYRNRITYGFTENMQEVKQIENEFWVSKITNLPENEFLGSEYQKYCNDSSTYRVITYPMQKNSSFYFKYKLEPGSLNH